jgi:hypothetical protein
MDALRLIDATAMLLFASIYLGTGVTLVGFLFPIQSKLTPDTYRVPFVEPVQAATRFFTVMTVLMLVCSLALVVLELGTWRWVWPALYLAVTVLTTLLTTRGIFTYNRRMAAGIADNAELQATLTKWRQLNTYRASLWGVEWLAITAWFVERAA